MKKQVIGKEIVDNRDMTYDCKRCDQQHIITVDFSKLSKDQREGREPVTRNAICPNTAYMYRIMNWGIDTRVSWLAAEIPQNIREETINGIKFEWGELNFDAKLERFVELDISFMGAPEEYYNLLSSVVSSHCCGYFYPAMTSAGSLGERILNRLIIKTRDYFKSSKHYKRIWDKHSFDNWDTIIEILTEWGIISDDVAKLFTQLKKYRNDSIHYNNDYNFGLNSHNAVKILAEIIELQFSYFRKDLFWVLDVPGEIWVRSEVLDLPFVKEFVLPHCLQLTPFCEPTANPPIKGENTPLLPLSDEEFIHIRNDRT